MARKQAFVIDAESLKLTVDSFVALRKRIKALREKEAALAEMLFAEMKKKRKSRLLGEQFVITATPEERSSLSMDKVRQYLTPAQIKRCTVVTPFVKITSTTRE